MTNALYSGVTSSSSASEHTPQVFGQYCLVESQKWGTSFAKNEIPDRTLPQRRRYRGAAMSFEINLLKQCTLASSHFRTHAFNVLDKTQTKFEQFRMPSIRCLKEEVPGSLIEKRDQLHDLITFQKSNATSPTTSGPHTLPHSTGPSGTPHHWGRWWGRNPCRPQHPRRPCT